MAIFQNSKEIIDMFQRTDTIKNSPQASISSTRTMLSAWYLLQSCKT